MIQIFIFRLFIFWYIVGIFLLAFDLLPAALEWANAVFLILAGTLGGIYFSINYPKIKGIFISLTVVACTMFAEWLGVNYNLFFGQYDYNSDFGFKIAGVPIAIGFAWLMVISTTHVLAKQIIRFFSLKNTYIRAICYATVGGFAAVVIDLVIDPVAFHVKEYWLWYQGGMYYEIPFSNFAGWFFLAFVLHLFVYVVLKREWQEDQNIEWKKKMVILYILIILMFVVLALKGALFLSVIVTLFATASFIALYRKAENK
ncbi:carotenoid biosynthesis protein [Anaerobacillus alkaliphilus]|uniref:Carotenoid biosynthesis protein n=1 Tax=Anaerobacillus alkaliphilus TaxID=1548597 RepID=A0A4V1LFX3_9BACI|nr:carotenoid biosynthesis protein [Anaerobacillus alkaliphilus]RXI97764.1 carotenoid biosynthesis protein [Anaerobacillus alkaliphilus]